MGDNNVETNTLTDVVPTVTLPTVTITAKGDPDPDACSKSVDEEFKNLKESAVENFDGSAFADGAFETLGEYKDLPGQLLESAQESATDAMEAVSDEGFLSSVSNTITETWDTVTDVAESIYDAGDFAVESVSDIAQIIHEFSVNDILDFLESILHSLKEVMACEVSFFLEDLNDNPENLSKVLGNIFAEILVQTSLALLTAGAGNAASALMKANKAKSTLGIIGDGFSDAINKHMKDGDDKQLSLLEALKKSRNDKKEQANTPSLNKEEPNSTPKPIKSKDETATEGEGDGKSDDAKKCNPNTDCPVNPVQGIKVLLGSEDTDFTLTGDLLLIWGRQYSSDSKVGRGRSGDPIGWYGQGWSNQWGLQLHIVPTKDLIEVIDSYGRTISFPYMAIGNSFYSRYEDIRLHHDAQGQYRITSGSSEQGDGMQLHFGSPTTDSIIYPRKQRLYCTGQSDSYGNRIVIEYHQQSELEHLPQYIKDSAGRLLQLNFGYIADELNIPLIDRGLRLQQITELTKLHDEQLPQLIKAVHTLENQDDALLLQQSHQSSMHHFIDQIHTHINTGKLNKNLLDPLTLVTYHYDDKGDLIKVAPYLNPVRRFDYTNHIMTAHHIEDGFSSYYEYDNHSTFGKVQSNKISNGQSYHFDYQDDNTIVTEAKGTDNERQTLYHFNQNKRWTGTTDGLGNRTTFILDSYDRIEKTISPNGSITESQYTGDNLSAIKQLIDTNPITGLPEWRTQQYLYDNNRLSEVLDPHGNSTLLAYDTAGQIRQVTDAHGNNTNIERDEKGRTTKQTLANGSTHSYEYNNKGELTKQTDCSGHSTQYQYDELARITQITDAQNNRTQLYYDTPDFHTNAPVRIEYPDGSKEQFDYDRVGRLLSHTDPKNNRTQYEYSIDDLPIKRIDSLGNTLSYEYDNLRRLSKLINENGEEWLFNYDKADNLISETRFDGYTSHYRYDKAGQLLQQTDNPQLKREEQKHTYLQRDLLGQLTHKHSLDFDIKNGQPVQRHHKSKYQYDIAGQLIKATSSDASSHLEYDNLGQLISESLFRHHQGNTNSLSNDNTNDNISDNQENFKQTLTHEYDEIGNRTKTTLPDGKQLNSLYYGSGHLYNQSITDENGNISEIRHSSTNELHQEISRQQGKLDTQFDYDPMGRLLKQSSKNSSQANIVVERNYAYDVLGQLTNISGRSQLSGKQNTHFQRNHQYQYDKVGRLTQHKLTDYTTNSGTTERFAFDPASNRVPVKYDEDKQNHKDNKPSLYAEKAFSADTTAKSDTWKRTKTLKTHNKEIQYYYDKHGRIEFKTQTPLGKDGNALKQSHQSIVGYLDTLKLSYNANDELEKSIKIHQQGLKVTTTTTHYCYDAFGRRIAKYSDVKNQSKLVSNDSRVTNKTIQSEKTQYTSTLMLWDGNRQAQEYTDTHVFTTVYEHNSFEPIARLVWLKDELTKASNDESYDKGDDSDKPNSPIQVYHYHNDHLGTPNELTNQQGEVIWLADYEAWGNTAKLVWREQKIEQIQIARDELQPLRFQGQFVDVETGLHYNRFRYYDADCGMFISRDPIGLNGGNNIFAYAPNPVMWIDPLGLHSVLSPDDIVCRGGTCKAEQFSNGSGVTTDSDGKMSGVSTQAKTNSDVTNLSRPFRNGQVGVATVADIESAGGKITLDGKLNSVDGKMVANHATVDGLTAEQAEKAFKPRANPVPKTERGDACKCK